MPGPFPGMDPYLESPVHWEGLHSLLIAAMTGALNAALPPEFVARIGERVYVLEPDHFLPDVSVLRRAFLASTTGTTAASDAVLDVPADAPLRLRAVPERRREAFIDIVAARQSGSVITAIELLSPANKATGRGREEYQRKQKQVLDSDTHFLEVYLLRSGTHTVAAPANLLAARNGPWDYLACLHRAGPEYEYDLWPRTIRDRLPRVLVPLTKSHSDVSLDLQAALDRAYDEGAFARAVDYRAAPDPPLSPEDAAWAEALLKEKGAR